jgi:hypothetical protein
MIEIPCLLPLNDCFTGIVNTWLFVSGFGNPEQQEERKSRTAGVI